MALATGTLTFDLADILGVDYSARRTRVYLTTNVPGDTLVDTDANKVRLGGGKVDIADDGTGSAVIWLPGPDGNPTSWQTYVHVDYEDRQTRSRTVRVFGPFTIEATADLADLIAEQEIPPTYLSTVTALLDGYVSDAAASADEAEAAAQSAVDISGISTSDGVVSALVAGTGGAGALTRDALSDTIEASKRPVIHTDPATKPNGNIVAGAPLDSGQTVVNNVGQNPFRYEGGRLVHTAGSTIGASNAGYLQVKVPTGKVRQMFSTPAWEPNSLGVAALVLPSAEWNQSAGTLPVAGFHLSANGNGIWVNGVFNPSVGQVGAVDADRLDVNSGTAVTLSVTTSGGTQATSSLNIATMTAATLETALEGLSNVGAGKVNVVGPFAGKYGIVWDNSLGGAALAVTASTGSPAPVVTEYVNGGVTNYSDYTTNGRFATSWDGDEHPLDVWLDPDRAECIIYFPDGTNSGVITDPALHLWTSEYAVFEAFENNTGAIDTPISYGSIAVGNDVIEAQSVYATKPEIAEQVTALKSKATVFTASGGGTIPAGALGVYVTLIAGGGGGGSGRRGAAGSIRCGGGGGGAGGVLNAQWFPASALGSSYNVVIGSGGAGGAAVAANDTNGNSGSAGTLSSFTSGSAYLRTLAGGVGGGGTNAAGTGGGAGAPSGTGGSPASVTGGAGSAGSTVYTGAPGGAGAGGGITTADVPGAGGAGGAAGIFTSLAVGGAGGVVGGAAPGTGAAALGGRPGDGPGGGAASITGAAQAGANAVGYGAGGAGGGASLNGFASGKGGDGMSGYAVVTVVTL